MRYVFFISDKTGITTESLGNALLSQFETISFVKESIPFVDTKNKATQIIMKIRAKYSQSNKKPIVITSILDVEILQEFKLDFVCHIDLFETFIPLLEEELNCKASHLTGKVHSMVDENKYYKRIEAINYSLSHDDGATTNNYEIADVILLGVSRVGKTPTCLYLAVNYGIRAANYPLLETDLESDRLPKILVPYFNKIFGLTIDLERLHKIRTNRLPNSNYASLENCKKEILLAERLMKNCDIPFLNTSLKSIEEISTAIIHRIKLNKSL